MAASKQLAAVIFLTCVWSVLSQTLSGHCPPVCVCINTTVRCVSRQLRQVPAAPTDTVILDLRFNRISTLRKHDFSHLPRLNALLLSNNEIKSIEDNAFDELRQLQYLYLQRNKLLHLPNQLFSHTLNLRTLRLDSNALVCDCEMLWFAQMLKRRQHSGSRVHAEATCHHPNNLHGRSLMRIDNDDFHCEKPIITMGPKDIDVTFGNTVYFTCRAEGNPAPEIVWMHNNNLVSLDEESRYSLLRDGTLMIENAREDVGGVYECIARNVAGDTYSNEVKLRYFDANVPPFFIRRPDNVTVAEGATVYLRCEATGHPRPTMSWTKNLEQIGRDPRVVDHENGSLAIHGVQVKDAADYQCYASNSVQTISVTARVSVRGAPVIEVSPTDVSVVKGRSATFNCSGSGDPIPTITWTRGDNSLVANNQDTEIVTDSDFDVSSDGVSLTVRQALPRFQGVYTCHADSVTGSVVKSARLIVNTENATPTFLSDFETISETVGSAVTMVCATIAHPEPFYEWMREDRVIQSRNRLTVNAGSLTILDLTFSDGGRYDCVAENAVGRRTKSFYLQVGREQGTDVIVVETSRPGDRYVNNAITRATSRVNTAVNNTLAQLFDSSRHHTISDLISAFRYPDAVALESARAEEIFEQTLEIIYGKVRDGHKFDVDGHEKPYQQLVSPRHLQLIANLSGCVRSASTVDCSDSCFHKKYRTLDGTCNNLHNPSWGSSSSPFLRLLDPIYENGFNVPVGWNRAKLYQGYHLPSPRLISSFLMSTPHTTDDDVHSHMLMQWGQFLDHDLDLSPQAISYARFSDGTRCNETCQNSDPCFPIPVPPSDQRIRSHSCMDFTRSSASCVSGLTSFFYNTVAPRQQLNAITSFIDASNVYGSSLDEASYLRELSRNRGLLRSGPLNDKGRSFLPFDDSTLSHIDCQLDQTNQRVPCFRAGDHRANEQLALTAMHTIWMRLHNQIASSLLQINNHWDGDKVYHEARKLLGAIMQHITFKHWLPKVIGLKGTSMVGAYKGYDSTTNPTIANEFATAAFRFGHSLVQSVLFRLNDSFHPIGEGNLPLHKAFFTPHRLLEEGGVDPILRGLFGSAAKKRMPGEFLNSELMEKLFVMANTVGKDLAALNIQRGRDHGLPFYNYYRELCGMERATTFRELRGDIKHRGTRNKLETIYGHPDNIDLFIGGISETPVEGAKVGPTFICIISGQFRRLRDGDRFYLENRDVFTQEQLVEIQRTSLAQVICQTTDVERVQRDVFVRVAADDEYVSCQDFAKIDLRMWSDCCEDCQRRGSFTSFASHFRGKRSIDGNVPHRALFSNQTLFAEHDVNVQNVDRTQKYRHHNEEHTEKCNNITEMSMIEKSLNNLHDTESRIDGLESSMLRMKYMVQEMHKKTE